jgi:hypothetical protein
MVYSGMHWLDGLMECRSECKSDEVEVQRMAYVAVAGRLWRVRTQRTDERAQDCDAAQAGG